MTWPLVGLGSHSTGPGASTRLLGIDCPHAVVLLEFSRSL